MKKIVSLTLAISFLVMSWSGIMLYVAPKGKVAFWTNWELFGLTKTQYTNIHITTMFLFLLITLWHIYYNWKPLISYIKDQASRIVLWKREFLVAITVNALFVGGALFGIQPFQSAIDLNDRIKAYWEKTSGEPPYGHAEESTLLSITKQLGVSTDQAIAALKDKNIIVSNPAQTLQSIATENRISAKAVYDAIRSQGDHGAANSKPSSDTSDVAFLGRRSLKELSGMNKIDLDKSLAFLKGKGVDATPETTMKEASNALGMMPYELYEQLKAL